MDRFRTLAGLDARALAELMRDAAARCDSDPGALVEDGDWLWHGLTLAVPDALFRLVGKFGKTFVAHADEGVIRGWNVRMRQARDGWEPARVRGRELTYGRYTVSEAGLSSPYPGAVLIDYGGGANRAWDPLSLIRDYVAEIEPGLWLGHMFFELALPGPLARVIAPRQIVTPSWFALARGVRIT